MNYIKLSVLVKSPLIVFEYNQEGRSFWDEFCNMLKKENPTVAIEKQGAFRYSFYMQFSGTSSEAVTNAMQLISSLNVDTDNFVITSGILESSDLEALKEKDVDHITDRNWFQSAMSSIDQEESNFRKEHSEDQDAEPTVVEKSSNKPVRAHSSFIPNASSMIHIGIRDDITETRLDLSAEAQRLSTLRDILLDNVRGQRHAVDEVVQTFFECDAFNRNNEKRRGPLATFLFTGPSGVGKTFLARQCAEALGIEPLTIDMSEYSDNLANMKFNGEHGQPAIVTSYVRNHPNGIIIFDEIEKAHINTIYLFLQILDSGTLMDMKLNKEVSFKDTIVFITTNAGRSLYDDPTVFDLSNVSRHTILEALRTDIKPGTNNEPFFPECITTRFANGHVILFNHLEPYALMQIVQDEIKKQIAFFEKSYPITVSYDLAAISAVVLYSAGGVADARSLRGIAKNMIIKELHDAILQAFHKNGEKVNRLKKIEIVIVPQNCDESVRKLFDGSRTTHVPVFVDAAELEFVRTFLKPDQAEYEFFTEIDALKRRARGVVDYILLDPAAGTHPMKRIPNDIEDLDSDGITSFHYLKEFFPEIPVYLLDTKARFYNEFSTLLAKGGKGIIQLDQSNSSEVEHKLQELTFGALVNNSTYELGRSGKVLSYNCSQYQMDEETIVIAYDKMSIGYALSSGDADVITRFDENSGVMFSDIVGCEEAKRSLRDFCRFVSDPRRILIEGKKIPKGVLLYGPPGTGKTMLAKAMANEAKAAFIPTTATALFGSLVGESERNVRELFRRARRYAPAIIFIDEVDAIARTRTGSVSTAHNEDTLNAFIAEMDGFSVDERRPVFIIAATNYDIAGDGPRVLDAAFVRRFDRKILIGLPNADDRFELLSTLLKKHSINFGDDHDAILHNLAERSTGLSNADLNIVVDMFLRSCEDKEPTSTELMDALDAFRFGEVNDYDPSDLRQTACHEAGHALVAHLLGGKPTFLTIVSRKNYGGYMEHAHEEKKMTASYGELMNRVCTALAGRAAEIEVYGKDRGMNTGASSDLNNARYLIKSVLNDYGMGGKLYTPCTDDECEELMKTQFERACALLAEYRSALDALTDRLYDEKSLDKAKLETFFKEHLSRKV